jgi:N-acetylmuramoyl-L-alanine amidase
VLGFVYNRSGCVLYTSIVSVPAGATSVDVTTIPATPKSAMKICIDAGHGMSNKAPGIFDPGAVSAGIQEADIALEWALAGKFILPQFGINQFLTRDDSTDNTPVSKRDDMARSNKCTHLLSIHCNAFNGVATGVEVFYRDATDIVFATHVLEALVSATGLPNRGLKKDSESQHSRLAVLDFAPPACLMEIGFIDNPRDRAIIRDRQARIKFWNELAKRIK